MRFSEHVCLLLNKFFPKVKTDGRTSPESYSEAQYAWAIEGLSYFGDYLEFKDKEILDAGCGYGGKTIFYGEQCSKHVIGVDIDEKHIKYAKEYARKKAFLNVEFKVANLANLSFESDEFDIILLNDVVEHISRPILVDVLKECKRVLKKEGRIFIEFPPWTSAFAAHLYDYIHIPWCQFIFSSETLSNVTRKLQCHENFGTLTIVENFQQLNHITMNEFKEIIRNLDFKVVHSKMTMLRKIHWFRYLPFFNKFLASRFVAILSK